MNVDLVVLAMSIIILVLLGILSRESDIEVTVKRSKTLEGRLKRELNAQGKTLGDLTENVKPKLPPETYQQLVKTIIPMRNQVVHEEGHNNLENRQEFIRSCDSVESKLDELKPRKQAQTNGLGCLVTFSVIALVIYALAQNPL